MRFMLYFKKNAIQYINVFKTTLVFLVGSFVTFFSANALTNSLSDAQASLNSVTANASTINFSCATQLDSQLSISPKDIVFYKKQGDSTVKVAYIISNKTVLVGTNAKKLVLSSAQKQVITTYEQGIRDVLPEVKLVINDSFTAAQQSVNDIFVPLLGSNSQPIRNINNELLMLKDQFNAYFSSQNTIVIDNKGDFLNNVIEQDVEVYIASLTQQLIADSSIGLISNMFSSGESFSDIQMKIQTLTQQLKKEMAHHKVLLNEKAKLLCLQLNAINISEEVVRKQIPELSGIDIFISKS